MKSVTYFVSPGDCGNSPESHGGVRAAGQEDELRSPGLGITAAAASNEFLKN
jgi:hypothetical protein